MIRHPYSTPATPSGISSVIAASGPYAALVSPSNPKIGIPAATPICSARSSLVAKGFPIIESVKDMQLESYRLFPFNSAHLFQETFVLERKSHNDPAKKLSPHSFGRIFSATCTHL